MSDTCTQNDGDCCTCSLSSYGRDCRNRPLALVDDTFRSYLSASKALAPGDYDLGYRYGLRRRYHGIRFGDTLTLTALRERGGESAAGLRDGLAGEPPVCVRAIGVRVARGPAPAAKAAACCPSGPWPVCIDGEELGRAWSWPEAAAVARDAGHANPEPPLLERGPGGGLRWYL